MEVVCLRHPEPSTAGSQFIEKDCSFAGKSWKPNHETVEGKTATCHNALSKSGKWKGGRRGGMVQYMYPVKTTRTVNANAVKAVNRSQYKST